MQLRHLVIAPSLALALSACGTTERPPSLREMESPSPIESTAALVPDQPPPSTAPAMGSTASATVAVTATNPSTPTIPPTVAIAPSPTAVPTAANELAFNTPTMASRPLAATVGPTITAVPLTPTLAPPPPPAPTPVGNCDPSYPTVCIPPAPPDLDCKDIPFRRFKVLPPDPHRFDGSDNDGLGCES